MQIRAKLKQAGQGMTEYIIIVALIAVAAIAVYQLFGSTVRSQTAGIAQEIAGGDAKTAIDNAQATANKAVTQANTTRSLETYNDNKTKGASN